MNTKSLVVLTLLVLGCSFASAQTYTFGFASADGELFCDYEQLGVSGADVAGTDNLSLCGYPDHATLIGFQAHVPKLGAQFVTSGAVLADNVLDVTAGYVTGAQEVLYTALKCSKQDQNGKFHGKYGWMVVVGVDGFFYGYNYGFLSCTIPGKGDGDALLRGPISGKLPQKLRK